MNDESVATSSNDKKQHFCEKCGIDTEHEVVESGRWEIYICQVCGSMKEYCVR